MNVVVHEDIGCEKWGIPAPQRLDASEKPKRSIPGVYKPNRLQREFVNLTLRLKLNLNILRHAEWDGTKQ